MSVQTFYGADISTWQGAIDWDLTAPTKDFFWYKGGGGDGVTAPMYVDDEAATNLAALQAHAKRHGAYWFAGNTDPVEEANYAVANVWNNMNTGAWAILDIERGDNGLPTPEWCKTFCDTAEAQLGFRLVIYMNQDTENNFDWSALVNSNHGLIIADYAISPSGDVGLKHWPFYTAQQYSSTGSLVGVNGNVDLDALFLQVIDDYEKYGRPEPVVSAPLPVPPPIPAPVDNPDGSTTIPVSITPAPVPTPAPGTIITPTVPTTLPTATIQPTEEQQIVTWLGKYNKFLVAIVGSSFTYLLHKYGVTPWVADLELIATALGVWQAPNL